MKRIIALTLVLLSVASLYAFEPEDDKDKKKKSVVLDQSMIRMQNRVFVGLEVEIIPSSNILNENLVRSLVEFRIGYRYGKNLMSGALGVEFTDYMFVPLTVEYKRYFGQQQWAPFAYVRSGISFHLKGNMQSYSNTSNYPEVNPGFLGSVGFGYSYTTTLNEFYFSLGYAYRSFMESNPVNFDESELTDRSFKKGVSITVGMTF